MKRKISNEAPTGATRPLLHLPERDWSEADRAAFANAFDKLHDIFDEGGGGCRLKPRTRLSIRFGYRRWLGWLSSQQPELLARSPELRATPETIKAFVLHLRATCSPRTVASQIGKLHDALRYMYPVHDWAWLRNIKTRLEKAIPKKGRKPIEVTSQRMFDACMARLDQVDLEFAIAGPGLTGRRLQALGLRYRNALLVAVLTLLPLRRSNIAQLEIGTTIRRNGGLWSIAVPGDSVKNGEPIDADLGEDLSQRIERYLAVYRPLIHRSGQHSGFWASAKGCPATGDALYNAFQRETKTSLGLHLTLHDARRVGATTWAVHDPVNAAGAKDLLGDRSDRVFAQYYNLANSIEASRKMAKALSRLR